jgi:hypothetical protein
MVNAMLCYGARAVTRKFNQSPPAVVTKPSAFGWEVAYLQSDSGLRQENAPSARSDSGTLVLGLRTPQPPPPLFMTQARPASLMRESVRRTWQGLALPLQPLNGSACACGA